MSTQAPFLHALADHMQRHDLPPVNVHSDYAGGWILHLLGPGDTAGALVAWARSCNVVTLKVRALSEQVDVEFCSQLAGRALRVWGCVDALRGLAEVSTDDLAYVAEHGVLPDRGAVS